MSPNAPSPRSPWAFHSGSRQRCCSRWRFALSGSHPDEFVSSEHPLTDFISNPDAFSVIVAFVAGAAGVLSLTSAKSGALIGVLVSVTTIPAAANIGVAAAYADWPEFGGAVLQLGLNLTAIVLAGVGVLFFQRLLYVRRRRAHLSDPSRTAAGLPLRPPAGLGGQAP